MKPTISSGTTGTNIVTRTAAGATVYTIAANSLDPTGQTMTYAISGGESALLTLDGNVVKLTAIADYETRSSYSFDVTADDNNPDADLATSDATTVTFSILPHAADYQFEALNTSTTDGYKFKDYGTTADPNLYVSRGSAYTFKNSTGGHPLALRLVGSDSILSDFNGGNSVAGGSTSTSFTFDSNNGIAAGVEYIEYYCTEHGGMVGKIYIID